jgi:hypothetical protein
MAFLGGAPILVVKSRRCQECVPGAQNSTGTKVVEKLG